MAGDHYFEHDPSSPSRRRAIRLDLADVSFELTTDAGVFSADRVDQGSKYLLMEAPTPSTEVRTALDLGCGYGPISLTLAARAPRAQVLGVDVNVRALALAAENAAAAALVNLSFATPDDIDDDLRFDLIWSNPPIRIGKAALHALLEHWLNRLTTTGHAVLVVQKHLGADSLAVWLTSNGWETTRIGSRKGYRLLEVRARS